MTAAQQLAKAVLDAMTPRELLAKLPRKNYLPVGFELSRGTLVTEDLIEAGLSLLQELNPSEAVNYRAQYEEAKAQEWDLVEVETELYTYLQREYCPPFTYLGSHPGSSADVGVWPWEDMELEHAEGEGKLTIVEGDPSQPPDWTNLETRYVLVKNDDNDKSLWDSENRQKVWEY